jgi:hypothetical protein
MIADVMQRIQAKVPQLDKRIYGAADFANLMRTNALPKQTPSAYVLGLGLQGGTSDAGAGYYTQMFDRAIAVVLTFKSYDATADRLLDGIEGLLDQVVAAVVGWGPNEEVGVFRLARGNLVSMKSGTVIYQIDFTIKDQLRIIP